MKDIIKDKNMLNDWIMSANEIQKTPVYNEIISCIQQLFIILLLNFRLQAC